VKFKTKPEIALDHIRAAHAAGVAPRVVLADAAYGGDQKFRAGITALGLSYVAGIQSTSSVWPPGEGPLPPKEWTGRGRKPSRLRRDDQHRPIAVKEFALSLPETAWHNITGREGSNAPLSSRFAAIRVRPATRDEKRTVPHPIEWPEGETEPTKYWFSTLPEETPLTVLVDYAKLRWRIEREHE